MSARAATQRATTTTTFRIVEHERKVLLRLFFVARLHVAARQSQRFELLLALQRADRATASVSAGKRKISSTLRDNERDKDAAQTPTTPTTPTTTTQAARFVVRRTLGNLSVSKYCINPLRAVPHHKRKKKTEPSVAPHAEARAHTQTHAPSNDDPLHDKLFRHDATLDFNGAVAKAQLGDLGP